MFTLTLANTLAAALIGLVGAWLGYFLKAYLERKGENLATKEDFRQLLKQITETARLTEGIKSELSSRQWVSQERWKLKSDLYISVLLMLSSHIDLTLHMVELLRGQRSVKDVEIQKPSDEERQRMFVLLQILNPGLIQLLQPTRSLPSNGKERDAELYAQDLEVYRQVYFAVAAAARKDLGLEGMVADVVPASAEGA